MDACMGRGEAVACVSDVRGTAKAPETRRGRSPSSQSRVFTRARASGFGVMADHGRRRRLQLHPHGIHPIPLGGT